MFWIVTLFVFMWIVLMIGGIIWLFVKEREDDIRQGEDV